MSISYPVDISTTKWAILQQSTGAIVARNRQWPVADGGEIPGQDLDFVYLLHVDSDRPDYDNRLYFLSTIEKVDADANEIRRTYTAIPRANTGRKSAAENEEAKRLADFIVTEREAVETRLMVGAILAYIVDQQQFPPKVRVMADDYVAIATKLWKNRDRLNEIISDIEDGDDPDLDAGWEQ